MVMLECRTCGKPVSSDERSKKCPSCGELLPFECAVCSRHLRPPIPNFPVEKYFTDDNKPLCTDHYQRQCPDCNEWFRADENPGFFICSRCSSKKMVGEDDGGEDEAAPKAKGGCGAGVLIFFISSTFLLYFVQHVALAF